MANSWFSRRCSSSDKGAPLLSNSNPHIHAFTMATSFFSERAYGSVCTCMHVCVVWASRSEHIIRQAHKAVVSVSSGVSAAMEEHVRHMSARGSEPEISTSFEHRCMKSTVSTVK